MLTETTEIRKGSFCSWLQNPLTDMVHQSKKKKIQGAERLGPLIGIGLPSLLSLVIQSGPLEWDGSTYILGGSPSVAILVCFLLP